MPPSRSQPTAPQLRYTAVSALKVAKRRYRGETRKDRFRRFEAIARVFADRAREIAPLCPHPMVRLVQYATGNNHDGRYYGICFRKSCTHKEVVQYLSEPLTPRQLYCMNYYRPADQYVRPSRRARVWEMVKNMLHAHGYDSDPEDVDAYIEGDFPNITGDEEDAALEAEEAAESDVEEESDESDVDEADARPLSPEV